MARNPLTAIAGGATAVASAAVLPALAPAALVSPGFLNKDGTVKAAKDLYYSDRYPDLKGVEDFDLFKLGISSPIELFVSFEPFSVELKPNHIISGTLAPSYEDRYNFFAITATVASDGSINHFLSRFTMAGVHEIANSIETMSAKKSLRGVTEGKILQTDFKLQLLDGEIMVLGGFKRESLDSGRAQTIPVVILYDQKGDIVKYQTLHAVSHEIDSPVIIPSLHEVGKSKYYIATDTDRVVRGVRIASREIYELGEDLLCSTNPRDIRSMCLSVDKEEAESIVLNDETRLEPLTSFTVEGHTKVFIESGSLSIARVASVDGHPAPEVVKSHGKPLSPSPQTHSHDSL